MKPTELRNQSENALQKLLSEKRTALAQSVVDLRTREVKNVREIRAIKRDIARILTILHEQQQTGETS